jgi:hypothetical protein
MEGGFLAGGLFEDLMIERLGKSPGGGSEQVLLESVLEQPVFIRCRFAAAGRLPE